MRLLATFRQRRGPATLAAGITTLAVVAVTMSAPSTSAATPLSGNPESGSLSASPTSPAQTEQPVGYASMNGGTTGGFGAKVVHEYTLSEYWPSAGYSNPGDAMYDLIKEHDDRPSNEGLVIYVDQTIRSSEFSDAKMHVNDVENVSILGVGTQGEFDGVGLSLRNSHNVVIRNLKIHHVDTGERDGITVQKHSSNVWIDHNEIYNVFQGVDKDYYDGLIDIKDGARYVTVSWNHLHDSWKTGLTAGGDSESSAGDFITYANNWFQNVNSRVPLIRRSHVHMLNNYFQDVADTAINARMGAQVLVEGNYFENVGTGAVDEVTGDIHGPVGWFYGSNTTGYWNLVDNVYVNTPNAHLRSTTDFTVPYAYDTLSPQDARTQAVQNTGVGVVDVTP
ncbi:right-handed parallel beta-helix repeat-containing protein [Micromonospora sp. NPDC023956]|uniref:pectate lyase family protein n=1 Tax=Micromonospora sp. NPDC023956 TaxID=3155722 RepID=UPI0033D9ECBF